MPQRMRGLQPASHSAPNLTDPNQTAPIPTTDDRVSPSIRHSLTHRESGGGRGGSLGRLARRQRHSMQRHRSRDSIIVESLMQFVRRQFLERQPFLSEAVKVQHEG